MRHTDCSLGQASGQGAHLGRLACETNPQPCRWALTGGLGEQVTKSREKLEQRRIDLEVESRSDAMKVCISLRKRTKPKQYECSLFSTLIMSSVAVLPPAQSWQRARQPS